MKVNWARAAILAVAASAGLPLMAAAAPPAYHVSDSIVEEADAVVLAAALQPSASDQPAYGEATVEPWGAPPACPTCQPAPCQCDACACDACAEEEAECEPWRLFCQKECGWNIYGWLDAGWMGNSQSPPSQFNGPVTFPDRRDGQMNQLYLVTEKTVDTGGCGTDWGGRVDVLYGTDYIFTQAIGLELDTDGSAKWNSNPDYGLALPQAYLELGVNDLSIKLGHFYTTHGYEVVPATGNFFYSHAYAMQYAEPFTHTGGLATWKASDDLSLMGAFVNGWDALDRDHDAGMGIVGFTFAASENLTINYMYAYSQAEPTIFGTLEPRHLSSLVITYNWCDWTYVFHNDVGIHEDAMVRANAGPLDTEWYGVNQYLFYTINDCWKAGTRVEWFRDDDGVRVGGIRPGNPLPVAGVEPGFAGDFWEVTAGLNYSPHANFTFRPEVRYDWYDGPQSPSGQFPYDDGRRTDQFLFGFDMIVLF